MGFIMEFLLELILEGSYEFAKSDMAPRLFRNFVVFAMVAIIILFLWTAFMVRGEGMLMVMPLGLGGLVGVFLYQFLKELYRRKLLIQEREE